MWGTVLKRDLLGEIREEDKFHTREQLDEYIKSEIERQGKNVVIRNLDVSLIEDLSKLFCYIISIESLDLSGWKTSGAVNISDMFYSLYDLKSLNLSGWDTSNAKDMSGMFYDCIKLKSLDLSGWDTSNVKDMGGMFYKCPAPYAVVDNKIVKR